MQSMAPSAIRATFMSSYGFGSGGPPAVVAPVTETRSPLVVAICSFFAALTFIVLLARLYARAYIVRSVGPDDVIVVFACLFVWAFIITVIIAALHGLGRHIESIAPADFVTYERVIWLSGIFYMASLGVIKLSVTTFYLRIGDRGLRIASMVMIAIVAGQTISNVVCSIFMCTPIEVFWYPNVKEDHCIDIPKFFTVATLLNITTDFVTYLLPMRLIWTLRIPIRQKVGVILVLGLGLFACVSSIVRLTYVPHTMSERDITWNLADVMYWSVIECCVAILAASIPAFKPLAKRYLPALVGSYMTGFSTQPHTGASYPLVQPTQSHFDQELAILTRGDGIAKPAHLYEGGLR
ncbi:MAG: hypothetical protein M1826_004943 [Phylliscum demangeonii]|nr:MAG: hypothetical protein M1826_004943 [Phylliscum demangeonii]